MSSSITDCFEEFIPIKQIWDFVGWEKLLAAKKSGLYCGFEK